MAMSLARLFRSRRLERRRRSSERQGLKLRLEERRTELVNRISNDEVVKSDEIASWEALARFIDRSAPGLPALIGLLPLLCIAFIVTLVGLTPVGEADIELDVHSKMVSIQVRDARPLEIPGSNWISVSSRALQTKSRDCAIAAGIRSLGLKPTRGVVTARPNDLLGGDVIDVSRSSGSSYQIAMSAAKRPDPFGARINVEAATDIELSSGQSASGCHTLLGMVEVGAPNDLKIAFELNDDARSHVIATDLPVDGVSFDASAEAGTTHEGTFYRSSGIVGGTLVLTTAGEHRTTLRAKETLRLSDLRDARVLSLDVGDGSVHVTLVGRARRITIGAEHRDLRPTRFESWNANQPMKLYWGAATYLFGVALAAMRMVRRKSA